MQNALIFLVEAYLELVLGDSSKICYYEVDFYNVHIKLHRVYTKVEITLEQKIIKLIKLSIVEDISSIDFSSS